MAVNRQRGLLQVVSGLGPTAAPARPGLSGSLPSTGAVEARNAAGAAFGQVAAHIEDMGNRIGAYADHAAQVEESRKGRLAGMDPEFRPTRALTIRGEAFDRAGLESMHARLRIEAEHQIEQGGDIEAKRTRFLAGVPDELKPDIDYQFKRGSFAQQRQASREAVAASRAEAASSLQDELDRQIKSLHQRAYAAGLDEQSSAMLAKDLGMIERSLYRRGPDDKPLLGKGEIKSLLRAANETATDARIIGTFERLESPEQQAAFLAKFEDDFKTSQGAAKDYDFRGFERITGQLSNIQRKSESQRRQVAAGALQELQDFQRMAEKGYAPTPDQMSGLRARAAALGDPEVVARAALVEDVATFQQAARRQPPEMIEGYALELRRQIAEKGPNPIAVARVEMAEALASEARRELKADPLGWAKRTGTVDVVPLDVSNGEALGVSLKARLVQADEVARVYRQPVQVFSPDEKAAISEMAAKGGDQMMAVASVVAQAAGPRATQVMAELAKDAPVTALLGKHVADLGVTAVAKDIAAGVALARSEGYKRIATTASRAIRDEAQTVHAGALNGMSPDTQQALIDAASHAFEVRAWKRGETELVETMWNQAYREVLGERQIGSEVYGGIGRHRGQSVYVPPDIRQDAISDVVDAIRLEDFGDDPPRTQAGTVTLRDLRHAHLVTVGDGRYQLNVGDDDQPLFLADKTGRRFVLDLKAMRPVLSRRVGDAYIDFGRAANEGAP